MAHPMLEPEPRRGRLYGLAITQRPALACDSARLLKEHAQAAVEHFRQVAAEQHCGRIEAEAYIRAAAHRYGIEWARGVLQAVERGEQQHRDGR